MKGVTNRHIETLAIKKYIFSTRCAPTYDRKLKSYLLIGFIVIFKNYYSIKINLKVIMVGSAKAWL